MIRTTLTTVLLLALIAPVSLWAATLTFSSAQPTPGANDIYNWTGAGFDADNIGGSGVNADGGANNGTANDTTTYIGSNRPAQGQTFTTGSFSNGYTLTSFTVRMAGYTNNIATGGNIGSYDLNDTSSILRIRVGRVSNTVFYSKWVEYAPAGGVNNPGQGGTANGPGTYLTFTFAYPVHLDPNTTYGVDLGSPGDYFEWLGIRTNVTTAGSAYTSGANGTGNFVARAQTGDRVFLAALTPSDPPAVSTAPFQHPGTLHTQADFDRIARKVAEGAEPWASSFNTLVGWKYANLGRGPRPQQYINRCGSGCSNNYTPSQEDGQCIYEYGLIYRITGDTAYADRAVYFMNAWSPVFVGYGGDSNFALAAGMCSYLFAIGGDLFYDYPGWAAADKALYQDMLANRMYGGVNYFLVNHNGTCGTHYRGNWDLDNITALLAIGVMADNVNIFNQGVEYWTNGVGVGNIERAVNHVHPDGIGQTEEVGRDQAHNIDEIYGLSYFSQIAWNQGFDMFGYDDNRVLRGLEQTAKYNLFYDILNQPHRNCDINYTETVSSSSRGSVQTGYEMLYNHYEKVIGTAVPWSKIMADSRRPEVGPDASIHPSQVDWVGFGTLMYTLDTAAPPQPPTALHANWTKNHIQLYWTGTPSATNYIVQRAGVSGGPYSPLATVGSTNATYIDDTVANGANYFYVVGTGSTNSTELAVSQRLVTQYQFETNTLDSIGTNDASVAGTETYTNGFTGQAIYLNGSDSYVRLPMHPANSQDLTITAWVNWAGGNAWQRIFDFGSDTAQYMFLTPNSGSNLRFVMTTDRETDNTITLQSTKLASNTWVHVAVSINGAAATLYVNGVPVTSTNTTLNAIFSQPYSYLGKSQFSTDPFFKGSIDDFRIYNYGLTGHEIWNLWGQNAAAPPVFSANPIIAQNATQGVAYAQSIAGYASGTFSKITGPAWLSVAGNGAITGTPGNSDVGTNTFAVRVTNAAGATDDTTLKITVINLNDAPTWTSNPVTQPDVTRGIAYSGTLAGSATDIDVGDIITFSKISGPAWLNVATNGVLTGTPGASDTGLNAWTVRVTDVAGSFSYATLNINVLPFMLRSYYQYEGNVLDSLGNNNGTGKGSLTYTNGKFSQAISLNGTNAWVKLSSPLPALVFRDITMATWANWGGGNQWQRIFDFGNDTSHYMEMTPRSGANTLRVAINSGSGEQIVETTQFTSNQWTHVAVTLGGSNMSLYVNGALVASNTGMTNHPSDFAPGNNLIGDSQFSADPFLLGLLDDFRIYNYALSASEITGLYTNGVPAAPTDLTATLFNATTIVLNWTASVTATNFLVKRASVTGGPYTVITTNATTSYIDTGIPGGALYYVVSALGMLGESPNSNEAGVNPITLQAYLKFNGTSGTTASDSTGHGWNGTLVNGATFVAGYTNNAVNIASASSQYVSLPAGVVSNLNEFTFALWTKQTTVSTWARLMDFGGGVMTNMHLEPRASSTSGPVRWSITTNNYQNETQIVGTSALATGVWTHVAVTLSGTNGILYVNGTPVGTNTVMLRPSAMGSTLSNYLGRSQYPGDPYFNGQIDEFRIYNGALSPAEVATFVNFSAPALSAVAGDSQVALGWSAVSGAASYSLQRSLVSGGPYSQIANVTDLVYTNTGLTNTVTYYYVVRATNNVGSSVPSAQVAATPLGPPAVPTGLTATGADTIVTLKWNPADNAQSYNVKRSFDTGGPYSNIVNVVTTNYSDTSVVNGTRYYYVVSTVNALGESANSTEAGGTPVPPVPPSTPTGLNVIAGDAAVAVAWSAVTAAKSYRVKRANVSGGPYTVIAAPLTASYTNSALVNGTTYFYVVSAVNGGGESPDSLEASATPQAGLLPAPWAHQDVGAVGLPGTAMYNAGTFTIIGSGADIGGGTDQFHFVAQPTGSNCEIRARIASLGNTDANAKLGVMIRETLNADSKHTSLAITPTSGIRLQYRNVTAGNTGTAASQAGGGTSIPRWLRLVRSNDVFTAYRASTGSTSNNWTLVGSVTNAMTKQVYIGVAITSHNNTRLATGVVSAVEVYLNAPSYPAGLTATPGDAIVNLSWIAITNATGYNVKRALTNGGPYSTIASNVSLTSWISTGLSNGTTNYYVVSALNSFGEGANSAQTRAVPTGPSSKLTGAIIGTPGSWNNLGNTITNAFDGNRSTFFDAPTGNGDWAGLDLGGNTTKAITQVLYVPRSTYESRMVNGVFQGANDSNFVGAVTLATITNTPVSGAWTWQPVTNTTGFRYVRYLAPNGGFGNVAELEFYGFDAPPDVPTGLTAVASNQQVALSWTAAANATGYYVKQATTSGGPYSNIAPNISSLVYTNTGLVNGTTYYFVVSGANNIGESSNSVEASATTWTTFQQWQMSHFGCTNCPQAAGGFDLDGDGVSNTNEFLAGTDPTNSASAFQILSIVPMSNDIILTWQSVPGKTNFVQANSVDIAGPIVPAGSQTGYVDTLALTNASLRIYRIRLAP